jgi:hypothetical protein
MSEKVKTILWSVFCLGFSVAWFTVLTDFRLMLFHVIPINNVVAGIAFAICGVIGLLLAFSMKKEDGKKDEEK